MSGICSYIIQMYFNIHCCGPAEGFMSVVRVCTLRTAWQLVFYISGSQPHTHVRGRTYKHMHSCTVKIPNVHTLEIKNKKQNINIQTTNPLNALFLPHGDISLELPHTLAPSSCLFNFFNLSFLCVRVCVCDWMITSKPQHGVCTCLLTCLPYMHLLSNLDGSNVLGDEVLTFLNTNDVAHYICR